MMKDVDSISRCIDPLVHQYNMTTVLLYNEDITKRPFVFSFDVLIRCVNPRHVTFSKTLSISITIASITSIFTLYHSPIKLFPVFLISLIPSILLLDPKYRVSSFPAIPLSKITWISFDLVINYFAAILFYQEYNTLQHFICESNPLNFSIATTISHNASIFFITFQQCISSLQHQLSLLSSNIINRDLPNSVLLHNAIPNSVLLYSLLLHSVLPNRVLSSSLLPYNDQSNSDLPNNACNYLLLNKNSCSFLLTSIQHVNGIGFTYHSHLHFSIHQWIMSLIPLLKFLVSSFRLECFCLFSRCDSPICLGLQPFVTMLTKYVPSWHMSTHSISSNNLGNKLACYCSLIHWSSFQSLSHYGYPQFYFSTLQFIHYW